MDRVFQDFIDHLFESHTPTDFQEAMTEATAALGVPYFAYLALRRGLAAPPLLISSYPTSWTSHYLERGYEQLDPVVLQAAQAQASFTWGMGVGSIALNETQKALFDEAAQFDIRYGLTIPVHCTGDGLAAVTFAAGERFPAFKHRMQRQARLLQLMAYCLHAHAHRKLVGGSINGLALSPRERECMKWAAEGKSHWDIGRILGISQHTVADHLENAKAKLGVKTNIQAVVAFTSRRIN
jgi:LuxR family transcriptional regulator, activator of conjugal transfer of Ti plasmids